MKIVKMAAPSNPITPMTFTGFHFAPKQDYYQSFQGGVLAKLAVSATCTSSLNNDGLWLVSTVCFKVLCHLSRLCDLLSLTGTSLKLMCAFT